MTSDQKPSGLWASLTLVAITTVMVILRETGGTAAAFLDRHVSLRPLTYGVDDHVLHLLMVPLAALVVVFCRLTLGIQMLGPFRPILIAVAIQDAGFLLGTAFLVVVFTIVVAIRPRLGGGWLPYFGRLSVLLSLIAVLLVAAAILGANLEYAPLENLALFPIVVLCLTADGFARSVENDGLPNATARAVATVTTAVLINLVVGFDWVQHQLFKYPELVLTEVALILFVSTRLNLGLFEQLNPAAKPKSQ